MRAVVDTNVLVSALLGSHAPPSRIVALWRQGRFTLLTSTVQLQEIARVTRYPKIRDRLEPAIAGRLVNDLRRLAWVAEYLPKLDVCTDLNDNFLLATAMVGHADVIVSGDKRDILAIESLAV